MVKRKGQMYKQRSTKHYTENEKHELHYLSLGWAQVLRNKIYLHQAQLFLCHPFWEVVICFVS